MSDRTDIDHPPGSPDNTPSENLEEDTQGLGRHAVSGVLWSLVQSGGGRIISMVVFVVLGRLLTPEDFGIVSLGAILIEFGGLLTISGFHRAIVQRRDLQPEHLDATFWSSLTMGLILFVSVQLSADWIAGLLGDSDYGPFLRVLSLSFLLTAPGAVPMAILHRRLEFRALAVRQLLVVILAGGAAVALAFLGAGAWALVAQSLTSAFVGTVIVWTRAKWRPRLRFSRRHWREVAGFGGITLGIDTLDLVKNRFDDLLIGLLLGASALGYYSVAYRTYAIAMEVVTYSLSAVAFPLFSRIVGDRVRAGRAFVSTVGMTVCVTLPIYLGLAILADQAVIGLFGDQWGPSVTSLRLFALTAAVAVGVNFSREIVLAAGRARTEFTKMVFATALLGIGFVIGVRWDIEGVAASRLAVALIFVPIELSILKKIIEFPTRRWLRVCLRPLPACGFMAGILWAANEIFEPEPGLGWLVVLSLVGGVGYLVALRITAPGAVREIRSTLLHRRAPEA